MATADLLQNQGHVGTPNYLAPELWGENLDIDYYMCDVYSLGVTFYTIFNKNKMPYNAKSVEQLEYLIFNTKPIPSDSGNTKLDELIMSMIQKDPSMRPSLQDILLLVDDIIENYK